MRRLSRTKLNALGPFGKPANEAGAASFAIKMQYRGEERVTELPLTQDMITQLAVEAAFRSVPICDLIGHLIMESCNRHAGKEARPTPPISDPLGYRMKLALAVTGGGAAC